MNQQRRTFAIGDIHADLAALNLLFSRLPPLRDTDTLVFLGDYVDRGPDSLGVIERVKELVKTSPAKVVTLRGNHEDMWIESYRKPHFGFLLPRPNGCAQTYRSLTKQPQLKEGEWLGPAELERFGDVASWLDKCFVEWMESLILWYEDEFAIYVHAGLESEDRKRHEWKHPKDSDPKPLLWMRSEDFFVRYQGKPVIFGHTQVKDLPQFTGTTMKDPWCHNGLIGIDTGSGKGGYLSAVELPAMRFYHSKPETSQPLPLSASPMNSEES